MVLLRLLIRRPRLPAEPEDRRDGTYYLDRKVSYNRGV